MKMGFRWYGSHDPVSLKDIRQVPGVRGIISALYCTPLGEVWPAERVVALKKAIISHGFEFEVIESLPLHEDIKLGRPTRDGLIDKYCRSLQHLADAGLKVVCYNYMPVFDWTRTNLDRDLPDGSTSLEFRVDDAEKVNIYESGSLPGWDTNYTAAEIRDLLDAYKNVDEGRYRENLAYFLKKIVPVAASLGLKMAIHPDDPPRSIFGLPRVVKNGEDLRAILQMVDHPANGLTLCSGSLGADTKNDVPALVEEFGAAKRIHFAHLRNIRVDADGSFQETAHYSTEGSLDMAAIVRAYHTVGFEGYARPDHGRRIWGEKGNPGYGLYDRALGATYLNGLWEATNKLRAGARTS